MLFGYVVCFSARLCSAADAPPRPNIILCMTDDQGWGDTGYNGHRHLKTPNLDAMSAEGITFTRWYSAAAMCSPTRGSCYTGRNPYRFGVTFAMKGMLEPTEIPITTVLKKHGYASIRWSIESNDYIHQNPDSIANEVKQALHPGAIVLMHDGGGDRSPTVAALPKILKVIEDKGYDAVTVSQLFAPEPRKRRGPQSGVSAHNLTVATHVLGVGVGAVGIAVGAHETHAETKDCRQNDVHEKQVMVAARHWILCVPGLSHPQVWQWNFLRSCLSTRILHPAVLCEDLGRVLSTVLSPGLRHRVVGIQ